MTNCIFYTLFFVLFLSTSMGSLRYSQINRNFMSIYKGMLEASVLTIDENGEPVVPYYGKEEVERYLNVYLGKNISRYAKDYTIETNFHNEDGEYCTEYCREVSITLHAKINFLFNYERTQTFLVVGKDEL